MVKSRKSKEAKESPKVFIKHGHKPFMTALSKALTIPAKTLLTKHSQDETLLGPHTCETPEDRSPKIYNLEDLSAISLLLD